MSYLCRFTSGIISLPFHNNLTVDPASHVLIAHSVQTNAHSDVVSHCTRIYFTGAGVVASCPVLFFGEARDLNTLWYNFAIFSRRNLCLFILQSTSSSFVPVSSCFVVLQPAALYLLLLEQTSPIHRRHGASVEVAWMKWRMDRFTAFLPPLALVVFRLLMALDRHINVEKLRHELRFYVLCCPSFDTAPGRAINYISHKPARVLIIMADVVYHTSPLIHAIVQNKCRMGQ